MFIIFCLEELDTFKIFHIFLIPYKQSSIFQVYVILGVFSTFHRSQGIVFPVISDKLLNHGLLVHFWEMSVGIHIAFNVFLDVVSQSHEGSWTESNTAPKESISEEFG